MDKDELKKLLPHREPMLLIESAEINEAGEAEGIYTVKGDEFFLQGHFPDNPVVPGVILCEMLAQTACVLFKNGESIGKTPLFTSLDNVRFKNQVRPGDTVHTRCRIDSRKSVFSFASGEVTVDGKVCVTAKFSFALMPTKK